MATRSSLNASEISKDNRIFSRFRATIETAFYRNNVVSVNSRREAYRLAKESPGTIVTQNEVYEPERLGLDPHTKILLFNDGAVYGRYAGARRIVGESGLDLDDLAAKMREAIYNSRYRKMYHAQAFVGLHEDYMVRAHLLIPEEHENLLYNWLLNFQSLESYYIDMYKNSKELSEEGDIFVYTDPDWEHPDHPYGLTFFDPDHNVAAILGMRYFGEFKKGTLTLAWSCASRNGYVACHGGQKRYNLENGRSFVMGVFGLSGSGKSTLTHAKHKNKYDVTILHDDAFIISLEDGSSVALEPAYFDKTADYPPSSPDNKYLLTLQNVGATIDDNGDLVPVTEDIRNGNGRAIKSMLWSPNRVNKFDEPVNAVAWLMKDPVLPPVLKISNPCLASALGATLATKRTSAERLAPGADADALVFEPYANPFRTYPLKFDYIGFKNLFEKHDVSCYVLNTGYFMDKKIKKETTLAILENIIEDADGFKNWGGFTDIDILEIEGFIPDLDDEEYLRFLSKQLKTRLDFILTLERTKEGYNKLPDESYEAIEKFYNDVQKKIT